MNVYRQGDVLFLPIESASIPTEAKIKKSRLIRRGEHGGLHQLESLDHATHYEHEGVKYVLTERGVGIVHGEHHRLDLPAGAYRVVVQREAASNTIFRSVVD